MSSALLWGHSHRPGRAWLFWRPGHAPSHTSPSRSSPCAIFPCKKGGHFSPVSFPLFCALGFGVWPRSKHLRSLLFTHLLHASSDGSSGVSWGWALKPWSEKSLQEHLRFSRGWGFPPPGRTKNEWRDSRTQPSTARTAPCTVPTWLLLLWSGLPAALSLLTAPEFLAVPAMASEIFAFAVTSQRCCASFYLLSSCLLPLPVSNS